MATYVFPLTQQYNLTNLTFMLCVIHLGKIKNKTKTCTTNWIIGLLILRQQLILAFLSWIRGNKFYCVKKKSHTGLEWNEGEQMIMTSLSFGWTNPLSKLTGKW